MRQVFKCMTRVWHWSSRRAAAYRFAAINQALLPSDPTRAAFQPKD